MIESIELLNKSFHVKQNAKNPKLSVIFVQFCCCCFVNPTICKFVKRYELYLQNLDLTVPGLYRLFCANLTLGRFESRVLDLVSQYE